jgi:hypothetical protein
MQYSHRLIDTTAGGSRYRLLCMPSPILCQYNICCQYHLGRPPVHSFVARLTDPRHFVIMPESCVHHLRLSLTMDVL